MKRLAVAAAAIALLGLSSCTSYEDPAVVAQGIVDDAAATVERFKTYKDLAKFQEFIAKAHSVVVLPTVVKVGFIGGAEGGNGVLLTRGADGAWGHPAFYVLGAASVGFQIGIQDTEVILVIRSEKALNAILEHQGKLGADFGITVGLMGVGMEASTTANVGADVVAFAHSVIGLYGGLSLEGAVLARRNDFNTAYYGAGATPRGIIIDGEFKNPGADRLRAALAVR